MSVTYEKLGLVELHGAGSANVEKVPNISQCARISKTENCFYYKGNLDGRICRFKIDTGSDVSVLSEKFLKEPKEHLEIKDFCLRYPTGELIKVKYKVNVLIKLGKHKVEIPVIVANISDDCILGIDFLEKINLGKIFELEFGDIDENYKEEFSCSRIVKKEVPNFLETFFEENSGNLSSSQKDIFADFLIEFQDVFSQELVAGNCEILKHKIEVTDFKPIKQAPRRVPIHLKAEVNKIIEEMKSQGVIEESKSPWISPVVMVKKKDGSLRFCVDYRKLNSVTVKDSYPLPRIEDILDQLSGNSWFSTLDLKSGYWQVKLDSKDKEKTAFSVGNGLWQFTVMPFGLCNAPATFEHLMEKVLQDILSKICLVYLDDVIVFSKTFEEMMENLRKVFLRFRSANLKLNPKKCSLFGKEVKYLGHVVSEKGITTDPEKISAIRNWPVPQNKKQLRSFLGFCSYYRKFIKGFSLIAKSLFVLTENQVKFEWNLSCEEAFNKLKGKLVSSPILSFPEEHGQFILDTDASNHGIGAVLSQVQNGSKKVIAYFSRVLNKAERNYCITRRELLAIVASVKSFHHYLYGRKFQIRTDHISLKWLLSFKDLEGQLARWLERLQQYEFEIIHRKGKLHQNADGLSRRPCLELGCVYCAKVELKENSIARIILGENNLEDWQKKQSEDPIISLFLQGKEINKRPELKEINRDVSARIYWSYWDALVVKDKILYKRWESPNLKSEIFQIIVPRNLINQVLEEAHDSVACGHFGVNKTLERIRKRFYWATCKNDVENWCRSCKVCVARKGPSEKGKSPLQIFDTGFPFERVQMDILGPLPTTSDGNRYLLVIIDCFTKWVEAFPLKNFKAKTIADIFVKQFVSRHGIPFEVHTDQGKCFESKIFKEMLHLLGIRKTRTTALHPQSDGQVERHHQTILNYLAKFVSEDQKDWDNWIPMFLLAYCSSKHEATGASPAELYFARDLRLPLDLLRGAPPINEENGSSEEFIQKLKRKLDSVHDSARQRLNLQSLRSKIRYDRKVKKVDFNVGQEVWFYNPQ